VYTNAEHNQHLTVSSVYRMTHQEPDEYLDILNHQITASESLSS